VIDLYYCAGGNRKFAEIAIEAGFRYGAQLPSTTYFAAEFADQDYKRPDFPGYLEAIRQQRPKVATVLDWMRADEFEDVMEWAEEVAPYVETVIVIPKVVGLVDWIPERIGGKPVRLGYSVPTRYGGTTVSVREFGTRPVHLLGGSPQRQMYLSRLLKNVVSADGNYAQKMAVKWCQFFTAGDAIYAKNRHWPQIQEADGWQGEDAPYEAFRRSCVNIMTAWRALESDDYSKLPLFSQETHM